MAMAACETEQAAAEALQLAVVLIWNCVICKYFLQWTYISERKKLQIYFHKKTIQFLLWTTASQNHSTPSLDNCISLCIPMFFKLLIQCFDICKRGANWNENLLCTNTGQSLNVTESLHLVRSQIGVCRFDKTVLISPSWSSPTLPPTTQQYTGEYPVPSLCDVLVLVYACGIADWHRKSRN